MLPRYIEGRLFSLFQPSYASKQEINKRQKGHDRFQTSKYENSIAKNNLAYPLLKDTFTCLEALNVKCMSVLDLKDAFHSLRLTEKSKKYCGILPYFGSASYLYQRMLMGLNISPVQYGNHT